MPLGTCTVDAEDDFQLKLDIRMENKGGLSDFKCGIDVSARWSGLSILETADLLGFVDNNL